MSHAYAAFLLRAVEAAVLYARKRSLQHANAASCCSTYSTIYFLLLLIRANYFNIISLSANQSNQPINHTPSAPFLVDVVFYLVDVVCIGYEWLRSYVCVCFLPNFSCRLIFDSLYIFFFFSSWVKRAFGCMVVLID